MKLSPEVNLLAVSHYLQALDYQRRVNQVVAILGGKTPNIQNLAVGGVANAINLDNDATLNMAKLYQVKELLDVGEAVHRAGVFRRRLRDRRDVRRLAEIRQRRDQLPGRARPADRRERARSSTCRAERSSMAICREVKAITSFEDPYFQKNVSECITHAWYDGDWTRHPVRRGYGAALHPVRSRQKVLLDQGASLRRSPDAGRSARAGPRSASRRGTSRRRAGRRRRSPRPERSPARR